MAPPVLIKAPLELQQACLAYRAQGQRIGLVPTMGALHDGHRSLVEAARAENDVVVVSIFVNPAQFAPTDDLDRYPRTPEEDLAMLAEAGADIAFMPEPSAVYLPDADLKISLEALSIRGEGESRPGHFDGVALVVSKLFMLSQAHRAYFGQKDFHQTVLIRRLVKELFWPLEVRVCPTARAADGLALSSRNTYLTATERALAPTLYQGLQNMKALAQAEPGVASGRLRDAFLDTLDDAFELDYIDVVSAEDMRPLEAAWPEHHPVAVAAAYLGQTRLIDNLALYQLP